MTRHTVTITYTRQSNAGDPTAADGSVELDIESIEIDGEDVVMLTTKATQAEIEKAIYNALYFLED